MALQQPPTLDGPLRYHAWDWAADLNKGLAAACKIADCGRFDENFEVKRNAVRASFSRDTSLHQEAPGTANMKSSNKRVSLFITRLIDTKLSILLFEPY